MYIVQQDEDLHGTPDGPWTYAHAKPDHAPESFGELLERIHVDGFNTYRDLCLEWDDEGAPYDEDHTIPVETYHTHAGTPIAFCPSVCTYGDYGDYGGSGSLGKANLRALEELLEREEFEVSHTQIEAYNTHFPAIPLGLCCAALNEFFEALADYPCADEELLAEVEQEEQEGAWTCAIESDAIAYLLAHSGIDLTDVDSAKVRGFFDYLAHEINNTYWVHETGGAWIEVEATLKGFIRHDEWKELAALGTRDVESFESFDEELPQAPCLSREESPSGYSAYVLALAEFLSLPTDRTLGELAYDIAAALPCGACTVEHTTDTLRLHILECV